MILASHQPNFLPYMGFFYKCFKSDILVISDDVLYSKKGMFNWNIISTHSGVRRISVPIHSHHDSPLRDILVATPEHSLVQIVKTLEQEYAKAPYFEEGKEITRIILEMSKEDTVRMADLNKNLLKHILERFGIKIQMLSATYELGITGHKDERIFQMCYRTGADVYYSGTGAAVYHIPEEYEKRNISLVYSDYQPIEYTQIHEEHRNNLSVIDYVFNNGFNLPKEWRDTV